MRAKEFKAGRLMVGRLSHGKDLLEDILDFAQEKNIKVAFFSALGAVQKVSLAFYNQTSQQYQDLFFDEPMEIASCFGNISTKDGKSHIHAHGVFANDKGHTVAGHIQPGTILFAGEIFLQELEGEILTREHDAVTGLFLWKM